jgi:acyl carrier protein
MDRMNEPAALTVVVDLIRDTLSLSAREGEEISSDTLLFYQLAFTSMDLLDLLFRVEQHFDIAIPEGTLYGLAQGELPDAEFATDSVLSAAGRARLMALLNDTPPELFPERIHAASLPRFCTVGAIARLVDSRLAREPCSS